MSLRELVINAIVSATVSSIVSTVIIKADKIWRWLKSKPYISLHKLARDLYIRNVEKPLVKQWIDNPLSSSASNSDPINSMALYILPHIKSLHGIRPGSYSFEEIADYDPQKIFNEARKIGLPGKVEYYDISIKRRDHKNAIKEVERVIREFAS